MKRKIRKIIVGILFAGVWSLAGVPAKALAPLMDETERLGRCGTGSGMNGSRECELRQAVQECARATNTIDRSQDTDARRRGFQICQVAARMGAVSAQAVVGRYLLMGLDGVVPANHNKAGDWLSRAAAGGHPGAQYTLGVMYLKGDGLEADSDKARELILASAQRGYGPARRAIADLLFNEAFDRQSRSLDVEKAEEALFWACTAGNDPQARRAAAICDMLSQALPPEQASKIKARILND